MKRINVTQSFLPPIEEYEKYLQLIWSNNQLTNQGPLLQQLEHELENYLGVPKVHLVANGTLALQLSLIALDIAEGEVITTPFSYVATVSSILWQRCKPVFVDIDPDSWCIDADKIEAAITPRTKAILPVHVFGVACDVDRIADIANKHDLKVIYDAAHAFGVRHHGKSLLAYGDISIGSFHATKLFHTIEGGCLIAKDTAVNEKIELIKRFGHNGDDHMMLGINAKATEFQAAMGLCNLPYVDEIIKDRQRIFELYTKELAGRLQTLDASRLESYNYAYYPVVFDTEAQLTQVIKALAKEQIFPRRYFYPSLNRLPYIKDASACPVAEAVAAKILCLPLYAGLAKTDVLKICRLIKGQL